MFSFCYRVFRGGEGSLSLAHTKINENSAFASIFLLNCLNPQKDLFCTLDVAFWGASLKLKPSNSALSTSNIKTANLMNLLPLMSNLNGLKFS